MSQIHLHQWVATGIFRLVYDGDLAMWSRCRTRKSFRCAITGTEYPAGTMAYRPVGNQMYRSARCHAVTLEQTAALMYEREGTELPPFIEFTEPQAPKEGPVPVTRSDAEIDDQMNLAADSEETGESRWPAMTYEQGVANALRWVTGQSEDEPMSED